ncbi:hypothetical protein RhiirA1_448409 [Rhizophagus irregularis]|uniref:F-box domain-containing protein n=5 Tax=Rhizophagus irregularis TaxID=588596 RepID=A0A2N0SJP1_9GLOM|nr:hypothetical protein RirG_013180 [Rhizophagus irregularis DAOM 197198w]PKC75785.1 hypothetical protein RhiirA1_448409 [Rhizophagus irregularis]UZO00003.1 hypothetical protein OCT59_001258 [Rhizophagus irregularis]GBC29822.1 hypothetical protein GLOIN_2v1781695 [Rhizophagus irregularis DAOM 181602=DAOM 197198]CAB5179199.1 unnamed protein product [Rhizophagus irregularis]
MSCSKILLGDLPELTSDILEYLRDDIPTLRSCILVNRLWCHTAIPLLWKDPFSMKYPKNFRFIDIYLQRLNEQDKAKLSEYGVNKNLFLSNSLFNYSMFIKNLNTQTICFSIVNWIKINKVITCSAGFIFLLLIKIFVENEAKLRTFELEIAYTFLNVNSENFNSAFDLILHNPKFINNIRNLKLHFNEEIINYKFLRCFHSNCKLISSLHFKFSEYESFNHDYVTIEKQLLQIINSQRDLEKIFFAYNNPLYSNLSSSYNSFPLYNIIDPKSSNTLKVIMFHGINFRNILYIKEAFEQLNALESIHILYCHILNSNFIQQIIEINKPFKLRSLFMIREDDEKLQIEPIQALFQKSGKYLENLGFKPFMNNELKHKLLELINTYCIGIKYFDLNVFSIQSACLALSLIKNFIQNINYLSIDVHSYNTLFMYDEKNELSTKLLLNLAYILPNKLEYLNLELGINNTSNDLEEFLKNSKHIFIRKLLFRINILIGDILPCIKEHIMKERRVEYIAIEGYYNSNYLYNYKKDLFTMTDELREFESYNIKVKKYNYLYIKAHELIDKIY